MKCVSVCPAKARTEVGRKYTVEEVLGEIEKDRMFYRRSGGGVTMSGGEILLQAEFVCEVLKRCALEGISTAIETSAHGRWEDLEQILEWTDTAFIDCKCMDPVCHKELTGADNSLILSNIRKAAEKCGRLGNLLIIRLPLIPGMNDSEENLRATAGFVRELPGNIELNVLPYHNYGAVKYPFIGLEYSLADKKRQTRAELQTVGEFLKEQQVRFSIGGYDVQSYEA